MTKVFYRKLWSLAFPLRVQSLMLATVAAMDALMLGYLDQNAMSAVSLATQVQFIQNMVLGTITAGIAILGAQLLGKRRQWRLLNDIFCMSLRLSALVSVAFFVGASFFRDI